MPNHVTTTMIVTGPAHDVEAFKRAHIRALADKHSDVVAPYFDFETVIPKPDCIKRSESSTDQALGLWALTGHEEKRSAVLETFFPRSHFLDGFGMVPRHIRTREALKSWLADNKPEALAHGAVSAQCLEETGYPTWYEWSTGKWGTKWGAYDGKEVTDEAERYVFRFETAWSFPTPIFKALATIYPTLVFDCATYDEGGNFGGIGQINGRGDFRIAKELATPETYLAAYGRVPHVEDDVEDDVEDES